MNLVVLLLFSLYASSAWSQVRAWGPVLHVSWGSVAAVAAVDEYEVQVQSTPLDSGRRYRFQVRAHNAVGWSDWSDPLPDEDGMPPPDFTASPGDGQVVLVDGVARSDPPRVSCRERPDGGDVNEWRPQSRTQYGRS